MEKILAAEGIDPSGVSLDGMLLDFLELIN